LRKRTKTAFVPGLRWCRRVLSYLCLMPALGAGPSPPAGGANRLGRAVAASLEEVKYKAGALEGSRNRLYTVRPWEGARTRAQGGRRCVVTTSCCDLRPPGPSMTRAHASRDRVMIAGSRPPANQGGGANCGFCKMGECLFAPGQLGAIAAFLLGSGPWPIWPAPGTQTSAAGNSDRHDPPSLAHAEERAATGTRPSANLWAPGWKETDPWSRLRDSRQGRFEPPEAGYSGYSGFWKTGWTVTGFSRGRTGGGIEWVGGVC